MSTPSISPRLTVLLSELCIGIGGHRPSLALSVIEDVRRLESQNEFLKRRVLELDSELASVREQLHALEDGQGGPEVRGDPGQSCINEHDDGDRGVIEGATQAPIVEAIS